MIVPHPPVVAGDLVPRRCLLRSPPPHVIRRRARCLGRRMALNPADRVQLSCLVREEALWLTWQTFLRLQDARIVTPVRVEMSTVPSTGAYALIDNQWAHHVVVVLRSTIYINIILVVYIGILCGPCVTRQTTYASLAVSKSSNKPQMD